MGFKYLDGKQWAEVTRDERFLCQRLYELVRTSSAREFATYLSEKCSLQLPPTGMWEIAYEVCFYRDLWQLRNRRGQLYSPKRTFDLCLFGESAIVIIEAKAAGGFDQDQNLSFVADIAQVRKETGLEAVHLIGLCSSRCPIDDKTADVFHGRVIRWADLSARYGHDEILQRADDIYSEPEAYSSYGRNSNVKLSGLALVEAFRGGALWWVGRGGGGVSGDRFLADVRTGRWRTQTYEVNTSAEGPPSANYFGLAEFVRAVGQCDERGEEPQ